MPYTAMNGGLGATQTLVLQKACHELCSHITLPQTKAMLIVCFTCHTLLKFATDIVYEQKFFRSPVHLHMYLFDIPLAGDLRHALDNRRANVQ